jgi:hypothetical protein
MKILVQQNQILALEDEFTLENGWYQVDNAFYEESICSVFDADIPSDYKLYRYTFEDGVFVETESYLAQKLLDVQELRAKEYPSMADYLDGIVKGDQAQVQAYIDACLAVKAKYPKPE